MSKIIEESVIDVISAILDEPKEKINTRSSANDLKGWDSVNHLNIILALQEEFDLKFNNDEINSMINIKIIVDTINSYKV